MSEKNYDLLVIGGGINGVGIARDAQGRGLKSMVVEKSDLGSGTSSASTKLIHGGLRYLETYEFRMVAEALSEREVIMKSAPHLVWPLRLVIPHAPGTRPFWMVRLGLYLYDFLGTRKLLPGSKGLDLRQGAKGAPLKDHYTRGFEYSDCWAQDAKLVALNAMDLVQRGGSVRTRTQVVDAKRVENETLWCVTLEDTTSGQREQVLAKALVNAAGPWADFVDSQVVGNNKPTKLRLVRGSHIITRKLYEGDHAYLLQNDDGRVIFVIPYEDGKFSLIGTTDVEHEGQADKVEISSAEIDYLCAAVNGQFNQQISPADVVWTYAGVRPLVEEDGKDASKVSRDYDFNVEGAPGGQAPLVTVLGGKLTAYRELSQDGVDKLEPFLPGMGPHWTRDAVLPGGDIGLDMTAAKQVFADKYSFLPRELGDRLVQSYGSLAYDIVGKSTTLADLGLHLGDQIYEVELSHLKEREFVREADDMLWRRSKLGLHLSEATINAIQAWFRG